MSQREADADDGGVAAGNVAFEAVAFVTEEKFSGAAADAGFDEPVGSFVSDRTDAASVKDAAEDGSDVPVEAELAGRRRAIA